MGIWQNKEDERTGRFYATGSIVTFVAALLLFVSCASRTKIEYVDRDVIRYETIHTHDTILAMVHDSIYHDVVQKGDTVFDTKYIERVKYRDKISVRCDTVYRDSIQTIVKELTKTKRTIPMWCYAMIAISVACVALAIHKMRK